MVSDFQILGPAQSSSASTPANSGIPRFQRHEVLAASVLRSLPNGTALLSIKGRQVPVKTHVPLQAGQFITLQVKRLSPAMTLQLVSRPGTHVTAGRFPVLLNALSENTWKLTMEAILQTNSGKSNLSNLLALIQDASRGLFQKPGSDLLSLLISKAGFNLESKLKKAVMSQDRDKAQLESLLQNDLKAMLLKAIGQQRQPQGQLKQMLSVIENFQLFNQEGLHHGGRIFLPIPMLWGDGFFTIAQLLIERDPSQQNTKGRHTAVEPIYTASLQLQLSRLGTLRAEIKLCAKRLRLNFLVSNPESKALIEHQLTPFTQTLADRGFEINLAACAITDSETDMEDLISELMPTETNILCLTA